MNCSSNVCTFFSRGRFFALILIFSIIGADQLTKMWVLDYFAQHSHQLTVTSFLNIVLVFNPGVSFGFLSFDHAITAWALSALAGIITLVLILWLWRNQRLSLQLSLALIIGGAIGNIIDRVRFKAVVDFIDFHWLAWHWPAFNMADTTVTVGVGLMIIDHLRVTKHEVSGA